MNIKIFFRPLYYNGNLDMHVVVNGETQTVWQCNQPLDQQQVLSVNTDNQLMSPILISLIFTNKNQPVDTCIDSSGKILHDKAIVIDKLSIDTIEICQELFLCPFTTENGNVIKNSVYFGFNGQYNIDIRPNIFQWLAGCKKALSVDPHERVL